MYRYFILKGIYMFNEVLTNYKKAIVYKNGESFEIPNLKKYLNELFEYAYFTSSVAIADHNTMQEQKKKGLWIELEYDEVMSFNESKFEKLLFPLKPKYDYINLYRYYSREYQGRCFGLSLGYKTTDLYNFVIGEI